MSHSSEMPASRFRYRLSPVNMRRGLWVVLGSLFVLLAIGALASESLSETILEDLQKQPVWALVAAVTGVVVLTVLLVRIARMARDAWLVVDNEGIRCSPHKHHGPRQWLRHDWQLPWSQIERAVVQRPGEKSHHLQSWINTTLTLESPRGAHDLALLHWEPVDDSLERPALTAFRPGKALHALTESHPLIRHLEQRGIEVAYRPLGFRGRWGMGKSSSDRPDAQDSEGPVDILAFKSLVIMLSIMGLLGIGAAAHFTVLPSIRPLWSPDYGLLVLAGTAVFALGAMLSRAAPIRERTIVALLLGASVGLLAHPLSVRLQSVTGDEPLVADYIVDAPGRFQPVQADYPALDLSDLDITEYWNSMPEGAVHAFELQKVAEDRYILRLDPLFEQTRAFYEALGGE
ncbi:MAG: hypothetical protein U5L08_14865 [Xanthomonadales bacterium]|nr:hypothetical protein [Xanthomonadales bacterium]